MPDPEPKTPHEPAMLVPIAVERFVAAAAMAAICLITAANVVVRYLTSYSFAFTEEYSVFLLVVMTLAGTAAAFAAGRHIRMTALVDLLPKGPRRAVEAAVLLAALGLFGALAWLGFLMAWDDYRFEVTSPGLGVPQWYYTGSVPVLAAAICLRIIGRLGRAISPERP